MKLFEIISSLFHKLFNSPLAELTFVELLVGAALFTLFGLIIWKLVKFLCSGISHFVKFIRVSITAKEKCKNIQCTVCGRTLDKCACQKNKGKSDLAKLMAYKREMRNKRK